MAGAVSPFPESAVPVEPRLSRVLGYPVVSPRSGQALAASVSPLPLMSAPICYANSGQISSIVFGGNNHAQSNSAGCEFIQRGQPRPAARNGVGALD